MDKQILITGTPRSGTTLLAQIVLNHPKINGSYDSVNFMRMCYQRYGVEGTKIELLPLLIDTASRIEERWGMELDVDTLEKELEGTKHYGVIYDAIMKDLFLKGTMNSIWCEKTTNVWLEALSFLGMFSESRVLHIVRNPKDVLASWKKFTHAPGNDYLDIVFNCYSSHRQAAGMSEYFDGYMMISYEELVESTEESAKRIARFLGVDYNKNMIDSDKYVDKSGNKWTGNSMFGEKVEGITRNNEKARKRQLEDWEEDLVDIVFKNKIPFDKNLSVIVRELNKSKLASDGMLKYLLQNVGVQRFPLDPTNPENWESEEAQLNKWKED